jgi:hypothetical protein
MFFLRVVVVGIFMLLRAIDCQLFCYQPIICIRMMIEDVLTPVFLELVDGSCVMGSPFLL